MKHFLTSRNHAHQFWSTAYCRNATFISCLVHINLWEDERRFYSSDSLIFSRIFSYLIKRFLGFRLYRKTIGLKFLHLHFISPFQGLLSNFIFTILDNFSKKKKSDSCSVVSDSLQTMDCSPPRLLCPQNAPCKNTGVGCHALLKGIFSTQGLNPGPLTCRYSLYWVKRILPIWINFQTDKTLDPALPTFTSHFLPSTRCYLCFHQVFISLSKSKLIQKDISYLSLGIMFPFTSGVRPTLLK